MVFRLEKLKCISPKDSEMRKANLGNLHHESVSFSKTLAKMEEAKDFVDPVSKSLILRFNQTQIKAAMKIISDEIKAVD